MLADFDKTRIFRLADRTVSLTVFLILLATYWLTVAPGVSYWDCPEYVTAAVRLEVGHPPGNPVWMLIERIVTMFVPDRFAALAVNLSSGLFTALAGMLLAKSVFIGAVWVLKTRDGYRRRLHAFYAAAAAAVAGLAFGWCDSTWYSAVEAEVYALSVLLTALSLWLMLKWARAGSVTEGWRYLILLAYVFGLSLGVHQLNLLCIPALAIIWALRRGISPWWKIALIFMISLAAVGCILDGMMPSTIALAAEFELFSINTLHLPHLWGVAGYVILLGLSLIAALTVTARSHNRGVLSIAIFPAVFLSGIFILGGRFLLGLAISALLSILLVRGSYFQPRRLNLAMWMLAMILTGYAAYAIIPIRGGIPAPPNAALPGEPFSFAAYQAREQYGAAPLVYGPTPYSQPLFMEEFREDSTPVYRRYLLKRDHRVMERLLPGARLRKSESVPMYAEDSLLNTRALKQGDGNYVVMGYRTQHVMTPELNMWFPRITSRDARDLASYEEWIGMDPSTMVKTPVSEAVDAAGDYVACIGDDGKRGTPVSYRPTYMQNLQFMLSYQIGYMYLRYLMWNFSGRQNDIPSQGEVEHGNFITGFPAIDNAMLSAEDSLPPMAGSENRGRNRYYMLPLLLGLWGVVWLVRSNWRGRLACVAVTALFVMTGVAIVIYLNQSPGEPRERDYTFLGSYMAFSIWMGAGALGLARIFGNAAEKWLRRRGRLSLRAMITAAAIGFIPSFGIVALMFAENFDDHDRSGRMAAARNAANVLNSLEKDAVIFVDGDNNTFPLWYAQEVEGIRRDVRVINLSYLTSPRYAASVLRAWNGALPLKSVLGEADIRYNAFVFPRISASGPSMSTAREALEGLRSSPDAAFDVSSVKLPVSRGDTVILQLSRLSRTGTSNSLEFRKLMMFDIIASNSAEEHPRPIYWIRSISNHHFIGLRPYLSESLFGYRLGKLPDSEVDSLIIKAAGKVQAPNLWRDAYMDETPAFQTAWQRAGLTIAAQRLLRRGHKAEAERIARKTYRDLGMDPNTFATIGIADSVFATGREFGKLFIELADSTGNPELRAIGRDLLRRDRSKRDGWARYRRALSPGMRSKMSTATS